MSAQPGLVAYSQMLEAVKRGVLAAGGLPLEFPTVSLGEVFLSPTSLRFRNLMAMDTEEMIRAQPMDSVVLMGGCDKTVPAALRYLADNDRPGGGEQTFNAAHLFQLASEVERMASTPLYAAPVVAPAPASRAGTADGCRLDWIERQDGIRATRVPAKPGVRGYWLIERSPQDEDRARGVNLRDALDSGMKL